MEKISKVYIIDQLILFIKSDILDNNIEFKSETPFSDLGLDSMSIIELVLFIERKFGIAISEKDLIPSNLKSVNTLAECTYCYIG